MSLVDEIVGFEEPSTEEDRLAYAIIGAALEVHKEWGPGFLESAYEAALCAELKRRNILVERQVKFPLFYKGDQVSEGRIDLRVGGLIIVEIKACESFAPIHTATLISYLKASNLRLGILINFNVRRLKDGVKRVVRT